MNSEIWLEDYRLAMWAGGADNDLFIIRQLPLYLDSLAQLWLRHPANSIKWWSDLRDVFVGNFQGTYKRSGNAWDLRACKQKASKSLRDYIRHFSQQRNELHGVADAEVISTFSSGTSDKALVHKIGCKNPRSAKELLDIATRHASGDDAVGAIFTGSTDKGKAKRDEEAAGGSSSRPAKKNKKDVKGKRKGGGELVAAAEKKQGPKAPAPP